MVGGKVDPDEVQVFKPMIGQAKDPIVQRRIGRKQTSIVYTKGVSHRRTKTIETNAADQAKMAMNLGRTRKNDQPDHVFEGKGSLTWLPGAQGTTQVTSSSFGRLQGVGDSLVRFDGDKVNSFRFLNLAIQGDAEETVTLALLYDTNAEEGVVKVDNLSPERWIFHEVKVPPKKWVELRIDLWAKQGRLKSWGELRGIRIARLEPKEGEQRLHVDSIRLEKP